MSPIVRTETVPFGGENGACLQSGNMKRKEVRSRDKACSTNIYE